MVPWLLGLSGLAMAVALLVTVKHYLDVRQASFFILRQRSRRKLRSSLALTTLLAVLTAGILLSLRLLPEPAAEPEIADSTPSTFATPVRTVNPVYTPPTVRPSPTATQSNGPSPTVPFIPTSTPSPTPTPTDVPSSTPTPSLTPPLTPTPSVTPTPSPTVPVLEAIFTPVTPFATLPPAAEIGELTLSRGVQVDGTPVNPGTEFQGGQPVIYVSFDYDDMADGVLWRHIWFRNDTLFGGGTRVWEWRGRGRTYFFLRPQEGFLPGRYEVQLLLEEEVVQTAGFVVAP